MDVIKRIVLPLQDRLISFSPIPLLCEFSGIYQYLFLTSCVAFFTFLLWKVVQKCKDNSRVKAVKNFVVPGEGPRFRKRDKLAFVSRKVMRNAKGVASYIRGGRGQKRKALAKFARRMFYLRSSPDTGSKEALRPNLPDAFLEVDELQQEIASLPQELVYVLKNMKVFGHFSQFIFVELLREIETIRIPQNQHLFNVDDLDENMYIVQTGTISVFSAISDDSGDGILLKNVKAGEPIISLLSFLDYLSLKTKTYKTVSAKAMEESKVIKLSFQAFRDAFEKHPENLARVIQIIMVRLQRVTLLALHQYLGLGSELINNRNRGIEKTSESEETNPKCLDEEEVNTFDKHHALKIANAKFMELLDLTSSSILENVIDIIQVSKDSIIVEENTCKDVYLILVLQGGFSVSQKNENESKEIHKAYPGALLCQLQVLTGEPSFVTVKAICTSVIAVISSFNLHNIIQNFPQVSLKLASSIIDQLSVYVRSIDFALEWILVESGQALYKQDDIADCTYVVLSGRLRSVICRGGKKELVAEYGRGELTGIVETLTNSRRSTTVMAIRDTEVAKLPSGLIDSIKLRYPIVLLRLINLLGKKLQRTWEVGSGQPGLSADESSSFSTVAIIAITPHVPISAFTYELCHAANTIGPTIRLTADYIKKELGVNALDKTQDFKLSSWLAQQEDQHRLVLYQCDRDMTMWTQLCIRHADVILMLVNSSTSGLSSEVTIFEERIENLSKRTRKELIFLHPESVEYPEGTAKWLRNRAWINAHFHIRCPPRLFFKKKEIKVDNYYSKIFLSPSDPFSDFSRLARILTGTSVGLVLGGGGARGCAHVGMIKAILEAGIPIDRVGGVSIGAFVGGLYCQEKELTKFTVKARSFAEKMNCWWRQVFDLTYPYTAIFTGKTFNAIIQETFEDRDIEDLWLPFFTVTTDITDSSMKIHDYGSVWRYVRSSMSLAGYLPPLCDPHNGHLLLDGGYTNNLPADIMKSRGARYILAIDVGAQDETNMTNYGDHLSGWEVMWRKWNPFTTTLKVPDQTDVQSRLAYVSCVRQLECVKKSDYYDYIRPPIDKFQTLQFGSFEVIKDVGYYHGKTYFLGLLKAGRMKQFHWMKSTMHFSKTSPEVDNSHSHSGLRNCNVTKLSNFESKMNEMDKSQLTQKNIYYDSPLCEESDGLISDEDNDAESGFLSQM